jgi:hypothetical protein
MTSPFRTTPQLGPNLHQTVTSGTVWFDNPSKVSPVVGTKEVGDDGHDYVWVKASAAIAAAASPGTQVTITEPAMTAAAGAGGFYAPVAGVASGTYFWARKGAL